VSPRGIVSRERVTRVVGQRVQSAYGYVIGEGCRGATDGHGVRANKVARIPADIAGKSAAVAVLGACVLWSLWPGIADMAERWSTDPRYAHGYLVPIFSLALLWIRRSKLGGARPGG
jgi:hypothetical protein